MIFPRNTLLVCVCLLSCLLATSVSAEVIFEDDFSSGPLDRVLPGVVGWRFSSSGGQDSVLVAPISPNGTPALEFTFGGNSDITDDAWAEQRFELGGQYPEIWVKYDLYIPENYYHRYNVTLDLTGIGGQFNVGDRVQVVGKQNFARVHAIDGNTMILRDLEDGRLTFPNGSSITNESGATASISGRSGMAENNKGLLQMWTGDIPSTASVGQYTGFENWIDAEGHSRITRNLAVDSSPVVDGARYRPGHTRTGVRFVDRNEDLGKWTEWIVRLKVASSANDDGVAQLWKNGELVYDATDIPNYSLLGSNYYERGYLLGYANSGFDETTTLYLDNFVLSTTAIVPEPGTLALLGLGGLVLSCRRRRRISGNAKFAAACSIG